ncbi:hypothetical protein BD410DRAFT_832666 [Rickenella mellea]|uniref:Uncharacterized protein n=1 Tax=Rickenella mellea TaxID=50990 RepID=A0A4Y7PLN7_9AGAM|nr:hypothetical protein BD410DRAFT_832666 [Rickenella mellea]
MSVLDLRSIAIGYNESIILPPNLLPHLTEVSCDDKTLVAILSSPVAHPRPITKIGGFSLMIFDCLKYFSSPNPRDLDIGGIEAIEKVSIPTKSRFMWMATLFPHLTSIHISFPTSKWLTDSEANRQWVEMLSNFPHLRVFHGHSFFRDPVNDDARSDNQDALTQLARIVPPVEEVAYPASKRMWERVLHLSREGRTITANLAITYEPSKYKILVSVSK